MSENLILLIYIETKQQLDLEFHLSTTSNQKNMPLIFQEGAEIYETRSVLATLCVELDSEHPQTFG